jgi:uncharacterized protein YjbJ (UPF0337 family)
VNRDTFEGKWHELKGKIKAKWGDLTDDDFTEAEGNMEAMAGKIQQRYGGSRDQIRRDLDNL